ncbi:MAG: phage minor head protein, partial [Cyanobacteria bacterium P01_F01_bin.3]
MNQTEAEFYAELIGIADSTIAPQRLDSLSEPDLIAEGRSLARFAVGRLGKTLARADSIKQARLKRDGWLGENLRQDADDPDELGQWLRDRSLEAIRPLIETWLQRSLNWMLKERSLEAVQQRLNTQPEELIKRLPFRQLERQIYESMLLANLVGREQVIDEGDDGDEIKLDANRKPAWLKQPFQEAIAYFRQKVAIPAESYKSLTADLHDWAFVVAKITQADLIKAAQWLVDRAISEGMSFDEFERSWQRLIGRQGWKPSNPRHIWTIFDTNFRGAMGAGRYQQMRESSVLARRPIWLWRWRDSSNPRKNHQALHNKGIYADHPFWRGGRVPSGFGCRCSLFSLSEEAAKRKDIEILTNPPDPKTIFEPGFDVPFNAESPYGSRDRQTFLGQAIKRYNPALQAFLKK